MVSTLSSLTTLRDQLKAGLSGGYGDPTATRPLREASELAQQIKALKAAHTIEAVRLLAKSGGKSGTTS